MKFFSINKLIEQLCELLNYKFEKVTVVMSGKDMQDNTYENSRSMTGTPCLIKVFSAKGGDKTITYPEFKDFFGENISIQFMLPHKFRKDFVAVTIDASKVEEFAQGKFYSRTFARLKGKALSTAIEQQKQIDVDSGIVDDMYDF